MSATLLSGRRLPLMMRLQLHRCPTINQVGQVGQLASFLFRRDDSGLFSDSLIFSLRYQFPHLAAVFGRKGRFSTSSKTRPAGNWSRVATTRCGLHGAVVEHTCRALISEHTLLFGHYNSTPHVAQTGMGGKNFHTHFFFAFRFLLLDYFLSTRRLPLLH